MKTGLDDDEGLTVVIGHVPAIGICDSCVRSTSMTRRPRRCWRGVAEAWLSSTYAGGLILYCRPRRAVVRYVSAHPCLGGPAALRPALRERAAEVRVASEAA
jgi:hypothetical protein